MQRRRLHKAPAHLEITAFINLIVVLVPFLLSTAVFSRLAVMDMALPGPGSSLDQLKGNDLQLEVVIRRNAFEVGDRIGGLIQRIDRKEGDTADLKALAALMVQVKARFPDKQDATVLAEPETPYDQIVQVMDAMRSTVTKSTENGRVHIDRADLFPNIAIGDAPLRKGSPT
jgi:biopolymer transport protein ExbD